MFQGIAFAFRWLVTAIFGVFSFSIPEILRRIFYTLSIGFVTVYGVNRVEQLLVDQFMQQLQGVPLTTLQFLGMFRIDDAFSLMISAWGIKRVLGGWTQDSKTTITYGKGGQPNIDPWSGGPKTGGWF